MILAGQLHPKIPVNATVPEKNVIFSIILFFSSYDGTGNFTRLFDTIFRLLGNNETIYTQVFTKQFFDLVGREKGTP